MTNGKWQMANGKSPHVAIVHDWLYGGGAEQVVLSLHKLFPDAPIYTSFCTEEWRKKLDNKVITGYLNKWPFTSLRKFLPLLRQSWFKRLDLRNFDLVISSSGNGEAKFVTVDKPAIHICYCHTPTHFYWRKYDQYMQTPGFRPKWLARLGLRILVIPLRRRDYQVAQNVDYFIANSKHIQSDIKTYYNRDSIVIHPPVDTERFKLPSSNYQLPSSRQGFVTVGRLVPYKRVDIIIEACNELDGPLTVVGRGPEYKKLVKMAGPTIKFVTDATDEDVVSYMASAEAFIFAAEEDFGITPVEALAAGTPVIAYKAGGALDYVIPGKTGEFFPEQSVNSLASVLKSFNGKKYDPKTISTHANQYSTDTFHTKFFELIQSISSGD